jgi:NAD(P)-dependent dehydrogenase (short-subunit alcohol dehydrogenase family)
MKKTCLITGANSGIGKEVALHLAQQGYHVILVCRNQARGNATLTEIKAKTQSNSIDLIIADLSSQAEVRSLANTILQRYSQLHVLINNAGIIALKKSYSVDNIEMVLATNHLGPFLLSYLLLDILKKSAPSRIINVSSEAHKLGEINFEDLQYNSRPYQFMKVYGQSKLLMNLSTFELARRLYGSGVTVNCLHPGAVNTRLGSDNATNFLIRAIDKFIKFFLISPKKAAQTPIYLATSPEVATITGNYFAKSKIKKSSETSNDLELAKKVWDISNKLVGITTHTINGSIQIDNRMGIK